MILDAGVLIAIDRGTKTGRNLLTNVDRLAEPLHTTAPVAAQVWRNGSRQIRLARALGAMTVHPLAPGDVAQVGEALRRSGTADVVDAHLYLVAQRIGHDILTSDAADFASLRTAAPPNAPQVLAWQ
ncbi:MAG: PIN domain-containing protein [Acidimicrobiales bacterium]|nr:PIN domain-containing protein [Acidimicrobiales bacterium]MXX44445.1 PIN domain-containing protein [Acidimicrobiales bacterium]MYB80691.1 PIN domain-containing protein [Acidimicrobiales bacterium]MYD34737.1 PIN domain-containing protein [Acidimicrobiales bacterium]MYG61586.1 PIN domain-containing protein [Acidimicrobiales bacterium]